MNALLPNPAEHYLSEFARLSGVLPGQTLDWLCQARETAIKRFARRGFPTQRDEDWKYTSVAAIENGRFGLLPTSTYEDLAAVVTPLSVQVAALSLPDAHLLVFVNGRLERGLCRLGELPSGVVLAGVGEMLERNPRALEEVLKKTVLKKTSEKTPAADVDHPSSAFADLNLAFMSDGAYVFLPPGAIVEAPIQLLFIASEADLAVQPRNLLLAAEGSSAIIVEHHVAVGERSYFTNAVTQIVLGAGASIEHHKLQQESAKAFHIATVSVAQAADSRFISGSYALGARLARIGIAVELRAEGAACDLLGLYLVDGRQHVDHHTRIDHLKPRGTSREIYKGVLNGAARAVFNGRVVVHPDAQGSDAVQTNRNLLLSENAEVDTKPQLEIWADDVKCSHGATVGQLDEAQVFYLRSRGIDPASARALLTRAFAREMIDRVRFLSLQDRLDRLLQEKLLLQ